MDFAWNIVASTSLVHSCAASILPLPPPQRSARRHFRFFCGPRRLLSFLPAAGAVWVLYPPASPAPAPAPATATAASSAGDPRAGATTATGAVPDPYEEEEEEEEEDKYDDEASPLPDDAYPALC